MALVKPILNEIVAFDINHGTTVSFSANGGDQVYGNTIKIVTNDSGVEQEVYRKTIVSYNFENTIPSYARNMYNGRYYKASIQTMDSLGNTSVWSDYVPFYCYTTPTLQLNIVNEQYIRTSSFEVIATYKQLEHEKVDYCIIELYNNNNVLIDTSDRLYNSEYPTGAGLKFNHTIVGLENNQRYHVVATIVTINQTIVTTGDIYFNVNFEEVEPTTTFTVTPYSCNGYINARSSYVLNINGISNPINPIYINDDTMLSTVCAVSDIDNEDLTYYAKWQSILIPKNFIMGIWLYLSRPPFKVFEMYDKYNQYKLTCYYKRGEDSDYLAIRTTDVTQPDHITEFDISLNGIYTIHDKHLLSFKVVDDDWDVDITHIGTQFVETIEWNDTSVNTVQWNTTSSFVWQRADEVINPIDEDYGDYVPLSPSAEHKYALPTDLEGFDFIKIGNGIYDELYISSDTSVILDPDIIPTKDDNTILLVDFDGNLRFKSDDFVTKFLLKRRGNDDLSWINIAEQEIPDNIPTYLNFNDSFIPSDVEQTYALVSIVNGVPTRSLIESATPHWSRVFIADKEQRFVLNNGVIYNNHSQNTQNATLMPIGAKYPIVIQNSECNYRSGSVQATILGYKFEEEHIIDRASITQQIKDILAFLTNGKAKSLTDYNGNIFICKVVNSPTIMYDGNYGNGIATISFDWVEQAEYNDYERMLDLGLFDKL